MPEVIQCPSCDRKVRVPDSLLGKKVKCPTCATTFTAPGGPEDLPAAALDEDQAPPDQGRFTPERKAEEDVTSVTPRRGKSRTDETELDEDELEGEPGQGSEAAAPGDWPKVRSGITLVLISVVITIVGHVVGAIGGVVLGFAALGAMRQGAGPGGVPAGGQVPAVVPPTGGVLALTLITGVIELGAQVTALVGYILCRLVPPKHGARRLAGIVVLLASLGILLALAANVYQLARGVPGVGGNPQKLEFSSNPLSMISLLVSLGLVFIFLWFLRAVARCLHERLVASNVKYLIVLAGLTIVGFIGMYVLTWAFAGDIRALGEQQQRAGAAGGAPPNLSSMGGMFAIAGCACVDGILTLAMAVWYIIILVQTRSAIEKRLALR
jgi:predicted Zn finger-like uncharacterized protein